MRARLDAALPNLLPAYQPERIRPFRFLAQKDEFVSSFAAKNQLPEIVKTGFSIRPRFELEARTIELIEGELRVAVAMSVAMQWEISASVADLAKQSVPLEGLYVVLKQPQPGERRLIGRVKCFERGSVELDESMDSRTTVPADLVRLEGSKSSFKRCLSRLLGSRYRDFEVQRDIWEARFTSGPSFNEVLGKFSQPFLSGTRRPRRFIENSLLWSIASMPRRRSERQFLGKVWWSSGHTTVTPSKRGRRESWSLCHNRNRTKQSRCLALFLMVCQTVNTRLDLPGYSICAKSNWSPVLLRTNGLPRTSTRQHTVLQSNLILATVLPMMPRLSLCRTLAVKCLTSITHICMLKHCF